MTTSSTTESRHTRYRRWTALEKQRLVMETYEPDKGVSYVARQRIVA